MIDLSEVRTTWSRQKLMDHVDETTSEKWFIYYTENGANAEYLCPPIDLEDCERVGNKVKLTLTEDAIKLYNSSGWKETRKKIWAAKSDTLRVYYAAGFVDVYPNVSIDAVSGKGGDEFVAHKLHFVYNYRERHSFSPSGAECLKKRFRAFACGGENN